MKLKKKKLEEVKECEWCERPLEECGRLYDYANKHYSGWFCGACCELSLLACEAVEKDNT